MRRIVLLLVLAVLTNCAGGRDNSETVRAEMKKVLNGTESTEIKLWQYERLKVSLASAYIEENKPDQAIELLAEIIKKNRTPESFMGQRMPLSSANYGLESIYYKMLADAYRMKSDSVSAEKAMKKSTAAAAEEARLKPIEEKKEAAQKKKEKNALLN